MAILARLAVILMAVSAFGQQARFDSQAFGPKGPLPNVIVSLCGPTATGIPCSPQVTSTTDSTGATACSIGSPVTPAGSSICQGTTDALGNFGFWLTPGAYQYCLTGPGVTGKCYNLTVPAGANTSGGIQASNINSVIWVDGNKYTTIAAANADCPSTGGKIEVPPNWSSSEPSWTAKQYCTIHHNGPCAVSFGTNTITQPAGVAGFAIESDIPEGSAFGTLTAGCEYSYTGNGTFITSGANSADTRGFRLKNIGINLNNAGAAAVGIDVVRVPTGCELTNLHILGPGGANTQQGIILDGTGNYSACVITEPHITGVFKGVQFTGSGVNAGNASKLYGGQIGSPASGTSIGVDFQAGSSGNTITGTDVESHAIGYNFGGTSTGNSLTIRSEANTSGVTFGASTSGNKVEIINSVDPYTLAGTNNQVINLTARTSTNSMVFSQACSGTASAATTLALQWFGGACTSAAQNALLPVSNSGTLSNLRVKCGTGGVNAASGVFTLRINTVGTALTCTTGVATACFDVTHTVPIAAGDRMQMIFTTQALETLADCAVSWEKQ